MIVQVQLQVLSIVILRVAMFFDEGNRKQFIRISEKQFSQRYQMIESLGRGAYGQVFKARSAHGNLVAIKQFKQQVMQVFYTIIREISNLKRLDHPNILKFYDCYIVDGQKYYMVTEFCPGGALTDFIAQVPTQRGKMALCQQMAQGLAYAHAQGIVHRDLKPQNILVGQRNVVKIGDFGCSTRVENQSEVMISRVGSPAYMDYRVGRRQEYDNTADIYSLGMIFMWVFEGKGIYDQCLTMTDLNHQQSQIIRDYENGIQAYVERLPTPIDAIVKNCLNPDYKSRFSAESIATMIAARLSQDKSNPNLGSTQDQVDEIESSKKVHFAYKLMSLNKDFTRRFRNEKVRETILRLLLHNQNSLLKIKQISQMKYVSQDTKGQFVFLVLLYYLSWLRQMGFLVKGQPSQLASRYPDIDARNIDEELLQLVERQISSEIDRISKSLLACAEKIQGTLHLVSRDKYLPSHFREFVRAAYNQEPLNYSLLRERQFLSNISQFFNKRVLREYEYQRGEGKEDGRIETIRQIASSFQ